jgi:hypothetical protein
VSEDRIDERMLRAHVRVSEADLAVACGVRQHARPRHLAPRPGRGRAQDEALARRLGCSPSSRVVGDRAALVGGNARRLGDIERRSAADADDSVEASVVHEGGELVGEGERRLARPLDHTLEPDARALGGGECGEHVRVRRDGLLDDDQRAGRPERRERGGKLGDDAVAEGDRDRQL